LARKLCKRTKSEKCLSGIRNIDGKTCNLNETQLIYLKSKGFLTYPDEHCFMLIKLIETSFEIHTKSPNVFDDTVEHIFNNNYIIPFPCNDHKTDIVEYIFTSYLIMRMRQFKFMNNKEKKSENKVKKKLSKLSAT
jgi:hypothetical protein